MYSVWRGLEQEESRVISHLDFSQCGEGGDGCTCMSLQGRGQPQVPFPRTPSTLFTETGFLVGLLFADS